MELKLEMLDQRVQREVLSRALLPVQFLPSPLYGCLHVHV